MPGATAATGDLVFSMKGVSIECIAAPCPGLSAKKGNAATTTLFHQLDTTRVSFVDSGWLQDQTANDGALVTGQFVAGTDDSGLAIKVLQASQVFLALPFSRDLCPAYSVPSCGANQVRPYVRGADLCLTAQPCMATHVCNYAVPTCGAGYNAFTYRGTNACPHVECDPQWIDE
jgi:hypothetical protein